MARVSKKLKAKLEKKPAKRRIFRGFKANLVVETEEFSINVPIRYQKITSKSIDEAMNIKTMSKSLGVEVKRKLMGDYHYGYITEDGREVSAEDVIYVQMIDGKEVEVQPYERTKDFRIEALIPRNKLWNFLIEDFYEVWSEREGGLWRLADYLHKQNLIGVCKHLVLKKGFKDYYGLLIPIVRDGEYTFMLALTRMNLVFQHFQKAKPIESKESKEEAKAIPKSAIQLEL